MNVIWLTAMLADDVYEFPASDRFFSIIQQRYGQVLKF